MGTGARYGSQLSLRRASVPEVVMRRCSLRSEHGASSAEQSPEPSKEPRPEPQPEPRLQPESNRKNGIGRTKERVDANHKETITTRSTKGYVTERFGRVQVSWADPGGI